VKGLDSNVILRYIVPDSVAQNRVAAGIIEAGRRSDPLFISLPVLCEVVWVLERTYEQTREEIAATIDAILETEAFLLEQEVSVRHSLDRFRAGRAGFADYLIGTIAHHHGCDSVYTFDRALRGAEGFRLL
jgi:predicted nucleic-acid-binding protein